MSSIALSCPSRSNAKPTTLDRAARSHRRSAFVFDRERITNVPSPILQQVARGDEAAVRECLSRYGGLVWSLARKSCKDQSEAEDAVQEIFLAVWQSAHRYDPEIAAESTFVAVIARRKLIDRHRRQGSRLEPEAMVAEPKAIQRSAEQIASLGDEAAIATEVLNTLPKQEVEVLRLSIFEGLTHSEIAGTTGLALGTVKTSIRRGLQKLRDRLAARTNQSMAGGMQ